MITYTYDANDRLLTELQTNTTTDDQQRSSYSYDHTVQTVKTVEAGTLDQSNVVAWQMTSQVSYTWNTQGRLAKAEISEYVPPSGSATEPIEVKRTIASYTYDDTGIRVTATEQILTDADNDPETEVTETSYRSTEYLNDPQNPTGYSQVLQETERNAASEIIKTIRRWSMGTCSYKACRRQWIWIRMESSSP